MRMYDLIQKKKEGYAHSQEEIEWIVKGYTEGSIPDYQMSAWLMAVCFQGMNHDETTQLTLAMAASGDQADLSAISGVKVDKHSTGGVGDKTTLILAPIVASCGVKVAKMSGRGLGTTGGTIDKLESIPGFQTAMPLSEFYRIVEEEGLCVTGQSGNMVPADKKIYALRDVTATVDSIPLITSSIMSKKLAAGSDAILLDVKTGSGAFMKTQEQAEELAKNMVEIGKKAGRKTAAVLTDMDKPLGRAIGNALEVKEVIEVLNGRGPDDLRELSLTLAAYMLVLAGKGTKEECRQMAEDAIASGRALDRFKAMIRAQGGDESIVDDPSKLTSAPYSREVLAEESGWLARMKAGDLGEASVRLKAGRMTKEDTIDYSAGIVLAKQVGDRVEKGDVILTMYASDEALFNENEQIIKDSIQISSAPICENALILSFFD